MGAPFSMLVFPKLQQALEKLNRPINKMIELACGTGTLAITMAKMGIQVTGVDHSEGMLNQARAKAEKAGLSIPFLQQDMRSFQLPESVDLVTSFYDSLNHLLSWEDLRQAFNAVSKNLNPAGLFIFDMNTRNCFEKLWQGTSVFHHNDFTLILENTFDEKTLKARSLTTLFHRKNAENLFEKAIDVCEERCYSDKMINKALCLAGFKVLEKEDFNPFREVAPLGPIKGFWVCEKV
jgi:predicted TPR repeat methyltransferase